MVHIGHCAVAGQPTSICSSFVTYQNVLPDLHTFIWAVLFIVAMRVHCTNCGAELTLRLHLFRVLVKLMLTFLLNSFSCSS